MSRIFVEDLEDEMIITDKIFHYLINVMKKNVNDVIIVFDGKTGEFEYKIGAINKKNLSLQKIKKIRDFAPASDVWLLFAPLKKEATDFVIEKATELGVCQIIPIITQRVNNHNFNQTRATLQAIEAAEQCERLDVPIIHCATKLNDLIKNWDNTRNLYVMLERTNSQSLFEAFGKNTNTKAAILVGPEGGFCDEEKEMLQKFIPVSMGPRILRAETAAISALASFQAIKGDLR